MSELESLYQLIVREFPAKGIRAILVGGHAVNAHGYTRATQNIDFIIDGDQENLVGQVMKKAGYTNQSRHETVMFCMKPDAVLRVDFLKTDEETMRILWQKRHQMELGEDDLVSVADIELKFQFNGHTGPQPRSMSFTEYLEFCETTARFRLQRAAGNSEPPSGDEQFMASPFRLDTGGDSRSTSETSGPEPPQ